jgi:hypothetical protein
MKESSMTRAAFRARPGAPATLDAFDALDALDAPDASGAPEPWWRVGVMLLFVGGLGIVVIASFALLATAIRHADVELPHSPMLPVPRSASAPLP